MKSVLNHLFLISFMALVACSNNQHPTITVNTELGPITAELYPEKAPITTKNFLRYIENSMFDSASFYRVVRMDNQPNNEIKIEVIQGGLGFDRLDAGYPPIVHETTEMTGLLHKDGTLSMARAEPGTASSEFFICIGDQPELDFGGKRNADGQGFAAFGQIIEGMDVVRKIQGMRDDEQMLVDVVVIHNITITK